MAKELSEDTNVQVSLKTLGGIAALIATIVCWRNKEDIRKNRR